MKKEQFYLIILPIILAMLLTIPFYITSLDIAYQSIFYKNGEWYMKSILPASLLYDYGPVPAIISGVAALFMIIGSYFKKDWKNHRRNMVFIFLLLLIGPGILVNAIFKEYMGRPRPRDIVNFGGAEKYVPPLSFGKLEFRGGDAKMLESKSGRLQWDFLRNIYKIKGKHNSFPAGHAAIGFFMMFPFFLLYNKRRGTALLFLGGGIVYGIAMGVARNMAGGHFLSDVIWAGFFVYFTGLGLFYALGYNKTEKKE